MPLVAMPLVAMPLVTSTRQPGVLGVHALSYHAPGYNTRCWDGKHISNQMFRVDLKQGKDRLLCIIYNRGRSFTMYIYTRKRSFTMYIYKLMAGVTGPIYDYNHCHTRDIAKTQVRHITEGGDRAGERQGTKGY